MSGHTREQAVEQLVSDWPRDRQESPGGRTVTLTDASNLEDWLLEEGRRLDCGWLHLDSVVGPQRFDAHRFYHGNGLAIYAHHFARML